MPITKLEEEHLSVVCLGSLNPAIFHPQWFLRMGLIAEADAAEGAAEVKIVSHEVTNVIFCGMNLQCLPERFALASPDPARFEQLQDLLVKILQELPHIPLKACGINRSAHYSIESEPYWHKIGHSLAPKEPVWKTIFNDPRTTAVGIKQVREGKFPGEVNIDVQPSKKYSPGLYIQSNWHYPVPSSAKPCEAVSEYLRAEWVAACSQAKIVAETIFQQIRPDND